MCCICLHLALCKIICTLASRTPTYTQNQAHSKLRIRDSYMFDVGVREMFQELVPITQKNVAFGS